ncbi:MAG: hypothetical protein Q8N39_04030 [Pelolinea sp.]|nr:hypothetical protein [Pelolinea sp.]
MKYRFFILILFATILSACKPNSTAEPTLDIDDIRTQAVQTALMEMTVQAVLNPSATPIPAVAALLPTATVGTTVPVSSSGSSGGSSDGSWAVPAVHLVHPFQPGRRMCMPVNM